MTTTMSDGATRLHHALITLLKARCSLPEATHLCMYVRCSLDELGRNYEELADQHCLVLHPGTRMPWVIHPFSLAPTPFLVRAGDRRWWGNCAWCSLGIAALIDEPCVITSTLGAEDERVEVTVDRGGVRPTDLVVHFPVWMENAWDNVIYTCSTMLFFRGAAAVRDWSARHRIPLGDIQPITKVYELARRWYGQYDRPDWRKRTAAEARSLFEELGLTDRTWQLDSSEERF